MHINILFQLIIPLVALFTGSYVLILCPQRKNHKKAQNLADFLALGARVQTASGINGTVIFITHNTVIIELLTGQKIEVLKQTVTRGDNGKFS